MLTRLHTHSHSLSSCIGQRFALMEEQTIISMIFNRYHLEVLPDQHIEVMPTVVSRSLNGIKVYVHRR
jgi:cytochrome P450